MYTNGLTSACPSVTGGKGQEALCFCSRQPIHCSSSDGPLYASKELIPFAILKSKILNGLQDHSDAVNAVTLHATGDYFVTASADRTWALYDVATGTCFTQARHAGKAICTSVLLGTLTVGSSTANTLHCS